MYRYIPGGAVDVEHEEAGDEGVAQEGDDHGQLPTDLGAGWRHYNRSGRHLYNDDQLHQAGHLEILKTDYH